MSMLRILDDQLRVFLFYSHINNLEIIIYYFQRHSLYLKNMQRDSKMISILIIYNQETYIKLRIIFFDKYYYL